MVAVDFKQVNNDLYFNPITGDFEFTPSDNQNIEDILGSAPGWWKNAPLIGAQIWTLLKGKSSIPLIESVTKSQLESDGFTVSRPAVTLVNGKLTIQPNAVRL